MAAIGRVTAPANTARREWIFDIAVSPGLMLKNTDQGGKPLSFLLGVVRSSRAALNRCVVASPGPSFAAAGQGA
jgi:hypothetical protein